jgi:hypothetical protein
MASCASTGSSIRSLHTGAKYPFLVQWSYTLSPADFSGVVFTYACFQKIPKIFSSTDFQESTLVTNEFNHEFIDSCKFLTESGPEVY